MTPGPGALIADKYRLDAMIAEGGYGRVWRATQLELGRTVAIKIIKPGTGAASRAQFDREARVLARLNHRNCVTLLDFGHLDDGRSMNRCSTKREPTMAHDGGECFRYACKAEFVLCTLDGGRPWPGAEPRAICRSAPADFPAGRVVWEFFDKHRGR